LIPRSDKEEPAKIKAGEPAPKNKDQPKEQANDPKRLDSK
jgi:hypothetical protein